MNNFYKSVILILFMATLSVPMIKHIIAGDKQTNNENRVLAQLPVFPAKVDGFSDYTNDFDDYLSDQFGFRENFIITANMLRYHLFNETTSKQITMGHNGYIYLNSHSSSTPNAALKQICNVVPLSESRQAEISEVFSEFLSYYDALGYQTALAVIPTKPRIYPEHLPALSNQWCDNTDDTWVDRVINRLYMQSASVYYPLNELRAWKKDFQVYLPKHFHWNGKLPYLMAQEMMYALWKIIPSFNTDPEEVTVQSDLNKHLHGLKLEEKSLKYNYQAHEVKSCRGACTENLKSLYRNGNSFHFSKTSTSGRKLLLITDSFGANIAEHFIRGFDEVTMINVNDLTVQEQSRFFPEILKITEPTHLLYLIHDGGMLWRSQRLKLLLNDLKK